ncbi:exonuclease i din7p-like xeroderma pigmentosum G N-region [Cryptosporidium sp. chipmunk genotype I]|uniref:exonuclease i din7p-like xeroderma pigmentosum G N-region n=1 Tax=Cryptosporidium sp. chipmunk genotype I TaxID=1280935 RepID=UPI00351A0D1C|nr:exonuclease i din7p-like xeroderma pigmentosum G N-region [Cryptosporidium sp. chipmunk genotype I]
MGIQGLLPNVDSVSIRSKIDSFKGKRVAIDTYGWLHRSAANCAESIVLGKPTRVHVNYCVEKIKTLQAKGIIPICVFDGATLPMKRVTEEERSKRRSDAKKEIIRLRSGKKSYSSYDMRSLCQKALDITPSIAHQVLEVLRDELKIECIVAPYEADAQLSYLSRTNYVDAVITEDSDMLVFGSICTIYKYDDKTGNCRVIYWKDLYKSGVISQLMFSYETFVLGCILTGCDYVKSPQGVGIKTAMKLVQECNADLERIILQLKELGKNIPQSYPTDVQNAMITFFHQTVYDPIEGNMVPLSKSVLPKSGIETKIVLGSVPIFIEFNNQMKQSNSIESNEMKDFIGPIIRGKTAKDICLGFIHPETHLTYDDPINNRSEFQFDVNYHHNDEDNPIKSYSNTKDLIEKENLDDNTGKGECDIEELIKHSIGSPINRKKSNIRLFSHEESHLDLKKKRRAIWLNSKLENNAIKEEIKSLDNLAYKA